MRRIRTSLAGVSCAIAIHAQAADLAGAGQEQLQQKDYAGAVASFSKYIERNPRDPVAYVYRGNAYYFLKQLPQAEKDFQEAIRLAPAQSEGYFNYGLVLDEQGMHERAIAQYRQAIKLRPNDASAYYNMGNSYSKLSQYKEAVSAFEQAARLNPQHPYASKNLEVARARLAK